MTSATQQFPAGSDFPAAIGLPLAAPPAGATAAANETGELCWDEVIGHRAYLVRFAQRRLRDPMLAEDVVHDVFESVFSGRASFAGRASLRSWLTAILKHKIIDLVRQRAHFDEFAPVDPAGEQGAQQIECPQPRPDEVAEQRESLQHTLARIEHLPAGLRAVMQLRVLLDQSTDEVCSALAITEDNLFVRLHRARRQLLS